MKYFPLPSSLIKKRKKKKEKKRHAVWICLPGVKSIACSSFPLFCLPLDALSFSPVTILFLSRQPRYFLIHHLTGLTFLFLGIFTVSSQRHHLSPLFAQLDATVGFLCMGPAGTPLPAARGQLLLSSIYCTMIYQDTTQTSLYLQQYHFHSSSSLSKAPFGAFNSSKSFRN